MTPPPNAPYVLGLCVAIGAASVFGCGSRSGISSDAPDTAARDAEIDAADAVAPRDTAVPVDAIIRPPAVCMSREGVGHFAGRVPGIDIDFPYVVAGVEPDGGHSCPRLFIRAGDAPDFSLAKLEIEVPLDDESRTPGTYPGTLTVYGAAGETWTEEILVNVARADGLFDLSVPYEERRASALISHHDATTDLEGEFADAAYCNDFAICI